MLFKTFEVTLALRALRPKRQEGFLSVVSLFAVVGVMIAVAVLLVAMALMTGFREEIVTRTTALQGDLSLYGPSAFSAEDKLIQKIKALPKTKSISPVLEGQAMLVNGDLSTGVRVQARTLEALKKTEKSFESLAVDWETFNGNTMVLGQRLIELYDLTVGESYRLVLPVFDEEGGLGTPQVALFTLVGTVKTGLEQADRHLAFIPFKTAKSLLLDSSGKGQNLSSVQIDAQTFDQIDALEFEVESLLPATVQLISNKRRVEQQLGFLKKIENLVFIIMGCIILVASFSIVSSQMMLVKLNTPQIGILRTMGMSKGSIRRTYLLTGLILGSLGLVLGVVLGMLIAGNIEAIRLFFENVLHIPIASVEAYDLSSLPAKIKSKHLLMTVILTLVLVLLAALYPAQKAASLDPAKAVKGGL